MIDWTKRLFGFAEALDLVGRAQQAQGLIADATALFDTIVDNLEAGAQDLEAVAHEAWEQAQELLAQQNAAQDAVLAARAKASKIREVFA